MIIFKVCMLLSITVVLRMHMGIGLWLAMSKKERKAYKSTYSALNRYFFWSAYKAVKDKYSKYERRIIRYKKIAKIYRAMNIILHLELFLMITSQLLALTFESFKTISPNVGGVYVFSGLVFFVVLFFIEMYENWRHHKKRRYNKSRYR